MTVGTVIACVLCSIAVLTFIGGIVGWVIKNWLLNQLAPIKARQEEVAADVREIKREVMPNGGASIADRVLRIETKIDGQDRRERS